MIGTRARDPISDRRVWQAYDRSRYKILFFALMMMLVLMPVTAAFGYAQGPVRLLCGLVLIAAVMPNTARLNRYAVLLIISSVVMVRIASERDDVPVSPGSMLGLFGAIGLLAAAGALRVVTKAKTVDSEVIYAALSAYLLTGIFFGQVHLSIESYWPGSYAGPSAFSEVNAIYFSFVTLATLGYGDFLPKSDLARGVTVFEVIGGQLYLAVMVARLIGLFPNSKAS